MTSEMMPERPANWPLQSFDAVDWAKEFMRIFDKRRDEIDEALMLTWFANALMRGFDEHRWRQEKERPLSPAAAEIVRLAEVALKESYWAGMNSLGNEHRAQSAEKALLAALSALLAEVREATGPIAKAAEIVADQSWSDTDELELYSLMGQGGSLLHRLKVGDLRRIAALHGKMEG